MIIKKSLGQNFLIDKNIAKKIININKDINKYTIIEVGPGHGMLTDIIIEKKPKKIILIEKDKRLFELLLNKYENIKNVNIYNEDAINYNYEKIIEPKAIISNLPYNISTKLIINWVEKIKNYKFLILMIQKEVADKMNFTKLSKSNRLSLIIELMTNFKKEFDVSPNVFIPKPKVWSSVISIHPNIKHNINIKNFQVFTRKLFNTKRKKLINSYDKIKEFSPIIKNKLDIDLNKRPEELSFDEAVKLFNFLEES